MKVLIPGFAVMILLLVASGWVGISAFQYNEASIERQVRQQRAITQLINDVHREENSLNGIFYTLAQGAKAEEKRALLDQLSAVAAQVRRTTEAGMGVSDPEPWRRFRNAAEAFIEYVRRSTPADGRPFDPAPDFFRHHAALTEALSDLVTATYADAAEAETVRNRESGERLKQALTLLGLALMVAVAAAVLIVRLTNNLFRRMEWQTEQLVRLSEQMLEDQENTARRFSRELHDEFGQTLSAIEASLIAMRKQGPDVSARIEDCLSLVKDAIGNVRELSQLLRPSILDDFGLGASLQWLAEGFTQRTGIRVDYHGEFESRLAGETETHLFRIAQEALTNIACHSGATAARMTLAAENANLVLLVADNGTGI